MCSGILEASQHTVPYNTFLQCKKLLWRPVCVRVCQSRVNQTTKKTRGVSRPDSKTRHANRCQATAAMTPGSFNKRLKIAAPSARPRVTSAALRQKLCLEETCAEVKSGAVCFSNSTNGRSTCSTSSTLTLSAALLEAFARCRSSDLTRSTSFAFKGAEAMPAWLRQHVKVSGRGAIAEVLNNGNMLKYSLTAWHQCYGMRDALQILDNSGGLALLPQDFVW